MVLYKSSFAGPVSGADETLVAYAVKLRETGYPVTVLLLFPFSDDDPYYRRLRDAGVPVATIVERAWLYATLLAARKVLVHFLFVFLLISDFPSHMRSLWQRILRHLSLFYYRDCCSYLEKHSISLVHALTPDTGTIVMIRAAHAVGIPVLYQELGTPHHVPELTSYYERLAKVMPLCTEVATLSPTLARQWSERLPDQGEISVLPLIVDAVSVTTIPRRPSSVRVVFGFTGRIEAAKGPMILLEAFNKLEKLYTGAYLRMAGTGPQFHRIKARSRDLGLIQACDFSCFYNEPEGKAAFLHSLDAFVLPTFVEGTPNSIIEAMSCGLPVIASAVGGIPDLVTAETGILVPPGDIAALTDAMLRLAEDPGLRQSMGRAAVRRYEELFSASAVLPMLTKTYRRMASDKSMPVARAKAPFRSESVPHPWEFVPET